MRSMLRVNPGRLAELRRQRELVCEHLSWLDGEIAAASGEPPAPIAIDPAAADALAAEVSASLQRADTYRPDPATNAQQARRGCLILALFVFALGALALTAIYLVRYRDRGVVFVSDPGSGKSAPSPVSAGRPPSQK